MNKRFPTKLAAVAAALALAGCAAPSMDAALGQANELASPVSGGAKSAPLRDASQRQASDKLAAELLSKPLTVDGAAQLLRAESCLDLRLL